MSPLTQSCAVPDDPASLVDGIQGNAPGMDATDGARFAGLLRERIDIDVEMRMGRVALGRLIQMAECPDLSMMVEPASR